MSLRPIKALILMAALSGPLALASGAGNGSKRLLWRRWLHGQYKHRIHVWLWRLWLRPQLGFGNRQCFGWPKRCAINSGTGTTTSAYGALLSTTQDSGTITNGYGVYISQVQGAHTWVFYSPDTSPSYFAGNVGIGTANPTALLQVNGTALATAWNTSSDIRLKKNVTEIKDPLDKILRLRGVEFDWRSDVKTPTKHEQVHDIGVIAQEVEKVFPEAVTSPKNGYKSVAYSKLIAPVIEAIRALATKVFDNSKQSERLRRENTALKEKNKLLEGRIERVEKILCVQNRENCLQ